MTPRTLKQIEIWTARIVQTHDLAVEYCVLRKIVMTLAQDSLSDPELLWPVIFKRLEHEKFRSDLANVTEREAQLLKDVAASENDEIGPSELRNPYDRNYFKRLSEKALLLRVGHGRYKLYHPLFREFLKQTQ